LGRAESIGRDVRLAQILIADRAHPDPVLLRDPSIGLKPIVKSGKAKKSVIVVGSSWRRPICCAHDQAPEPWVGEP
jgi:hypothetical protein